ncbi:MAG TPA: CPBP family intramembrane metalloprotease [Thermofilum sp.]|nr:CPBP family intramembrane metalloprotease [Thermofilum sp.]
MVNAQATYNALSKFPSLWVYSALLSMGVLASISGYSSLYFAAAFVSFLCYSFLFSKLRLGKFSFLNILFGVMPHVIVFSLAGVLTWAFIVPVGAYRVLWSIFSVIAEEAFFRGSMLREFSRCKFGGYFVSFLFALFNIPLFNFASGVFLFLPYFLLGEILRKIYGKNGLAGAFLTHFTYNLLGYTYVLIYSPAAIVLLVFANLITLLTLNIVLVEAY